MRIRIKISHLCPALLFTLLASGAAFAQQRDLYTQRLVLDDNNGGGVLNHLTIATPGDLPADRTLTIPDPGVDGAYFLLAASGSTGLTEIETPNADETLRLNPSGDLVRIGNESNRNASSGLAVYGNVAMSGPVVSMATSEGQGQITISDDHVEVVSETITIQGNLVVRGNATIQGRLTVTGFGSSIGNGADLTQLQVTGASSGGADHLYVLGNTRVTNELRIGPSSGTNTSAFRVGAQTGNITYTLPTSLPAAAATGTSMGSGLMQTTSNGTMSWRNVGTATAAVDFASTGDGATNDQTITVTGAAPGDLVLLGIPNNAQPAGSAWYQAWVSANDTVTIRFYNETGAAADPADGNFSVMVMRP